MAFFLVEFFFLIFPLLFFFVLSLFSSTHHPLYQERRTARCEACRVRKIILNSFALLERRGEKEGNSIVFFFRFRFFFFAESGKKKKR